MSTKCSETLSPLFDLNITDGPPDIGQTFYLFLVTPQVIIEFSLPYSDNRCELIDLVKIG